MDKPNFGHTLLLMLFGQFLDHDMSKTAISKISASPKGRFSRSLDVSALAGCYLADLTPNVSPLM